MYMIGFFYTISRTGSTSFSSEMPKASRDSKHDFMLISIIGSTMRG
jgi:hypothetical protein